jgi:plastocyanin
MTTRRAATLLTALIVSAGLVACSNRQASPNREGHPGAATASVVDGVQQITLTVDSSFRFNPSTITVHQGTVKITLVHKGTGAPHDFSVVKFPADNVPLARAGATTSATFTTPSPGSYQFVCTIHVAQGMTGTLVVLPS